MNRSISASLLFLTSICAFAQQPPTTPAQQSPIIFLDPAHGGAELGGQIADNLYEKDVNLRLANRVLNLLQARGFTPRLTRDSDATAQPVNIRAGLANAAHPLACIVLHTTTSGNGVHIYTSALAEHTAMDPTATPNVLLKWKEAQRPYITRSLQLATDTAKALSRTNTAATVGRGWLAPLDSLQCPSILVEVAPLLVGSRTTSPNDDGYQQRIAEALAGVLLALKNTQAVATP